MGANTRSTESVAARSCLPVLFRALLLGFMLKSEDCAAAPSRKPVWNLEALVAALAKRPEGTARYTETRTLKILTTPVHSSGTLRYRKPDYLEKHVLLPREEILRVEGDRVTVEDGSPDSPRVLHLSEHPEVLVIIESIRAPLTGNLELLKTLFQFSLGGSERHWLLSLAPREPRFAELLRAVHVHGSGDRVTGIEIEERSGDKSAMRIEPTQ